MSSPDYLLERFILSLYSKIFSAVSHIELDNLGLKAKVKFNLNFTNYPREISVFIPRRFDRKKDYFNVGVPLLHKPYKKSNFTQPYIRDKKNEYSRLFERSFTQQDYVPHIFELLEKWLIFRFFHFLFKFTGNMRNKENQIDLFESTPSARFWDIIKPFLFPFWFIKFFSKSFPKLIQFLENVKGFNNYSTTIQNLKKKMDVSNDFFEKFNGLYPVWFDDDNFYICKFLEVKEINNIFFGDKEPPKWFFNLKNNFKKHGYKFNKKDTIWLNNIENSKISIGKYVCFYFNQKKY